MNICELSISLSTSTGPPPAVDKTPAALTTNPAPIAPSNAPPNALQTPVIAQSLAIVCFNETFACKPLLIWFCTSDVTFVKYDNLYFVIAELKEVLLYKTKELL